MDFDGMVAYDVFDEGVTFLVFFDAWKGFST